MRNTIFILLFSSFFIGIKEKKGDFTVKMENGKSFEVFTIYDKNGLLEKYRADISAPVCEDQVCYDVHIAFNWNLFGEFKDFEIQKNDPLTKLDHKPFLSEDYQKLQSILVNRDLNFVKVPAIELVEKPDKPKVDGYSGATKLTIKKEVIEGALFTCYTLWHIANGAVVDSIKNHTKAAMNKSLVSKIIGLKSQTANYYLINSLNKEGFSENIDALLGVVLESEGYFAKNAFEKIPEDIFGTNSLQKFIIKNFQKQDYFTQKAILQKLEKVKHLPELKNYLIQQIEIHNSLKNQQLITLVLKDLDKENLQKLLVKLNEFKIPVSESNFILLKKTAIKFDLIINNIVKL
jgi:hypothetical protein